MAIYSVNVGRVGKSTHRAGTAAAHARYIVRASAASVVLAEYMPTGSRAVSTWLNREEQADRKNARMIEKIMAALPIELHPLQQQALIRRYTRRITGGRAPWLAAIHDQGKDRQNPHTHILIRDRDIKTGKRVARLSEKGSCEWLRQLWEEEANRALEAAGFRQRIDRRRLQAQGIDRVPQRHKGPQRSQSQGNSVAVQRRTYANAPAFTCE